MTRSFLFVPADSERKMEKARSAGADALILDLEDAVAPERRDAARTLAQQYLAGKDDVWVRINPVDGSDAAEDLDAVMPSAPAGIVLPKPRSADDALALAAMLDTLEERHGIDAGSTRILALCTERPGALFVLEGFATATPRLAALSWGSEDLAAALGASRNRDTDGNWLPVYELARSLCLIAAAAAGVAAVDTVFTDFRDLDGLATYAANARRDGFSGMLAIHPAQVAVINHAFAPAAEEIAKARRIVAAFAAHPGAGALGLEGEMLDRPHLVQAQRTLALAEKLELDQNEAE